MKNLYLVAAAVSCTVFGAVSPATAQEAAAPQFQPVEMYVCNYRDGKGQREFDRALRLMSEVESSDEPYAGWRLFPYMVTPEQEFDFIYFGAYRDGKGYGRDMAAYVKMAADAGKAWDEAAECDTSLWASHQIMAPPEGEDDGEFLLSFQDCKIAEGRTAMQAMDGLRRWAKYRSDNGSQLGTWAWFPVYGAAAEDFHFKLIGGFDSLVDVGNSFSWMVDNQAYLVRDDMLGGLVSCDVGRLYSGEEILNTFPDN